MRRIAIFAVTALCGALAGCASADPADLRADRSGQAYGAFLAAQHAERTSQIAESSSYYRTALELAPDDPLLLERAFLAAMRGGDFDEAARLAERALGAPSTDRLARVVLASRAVKEGRPRRAVTMLEDVDLGPFNRVVGSLVLAWAYADLGDTDAALDALDPPRDAQILGHLMTLHRAMILERAGRDEQADDAYREAYESGLIRPVVVAAYGARLEREGRTAEAMGLYTRHLNDFPDDQVAIDALARIAQGGRAEAFAASPAKAASLAVYGPAATLASNAPSDLALIYLRLAVYLDPENGLARQHLGFLLDQLMYQPDEAVRVYDAAPDSSTYLTQIRIAEASTLLRLGREEQALSVLTELDTGAEDWRASSALADLYSSLERFEDAGRIYRQLIDASEAEDGAAAWELYFSYAVTLERRDRWDEAEEYFQRALEIEPDQAQVLNYLGYSWVDRGEHLEEAFELIRRAVELEPNSGYIVDSLGWAHYRLGEFDEAVRHLERAVELDPQDPTLNDHLGDAYWRVGRRLEASYQWRRSLTLDPDEELAAALADKLDAGLPPVVDEPMIASP
ncbi:MAG: tetratricopeptide repeat protein [Maricaulaceae bacterium]|jgi:Flp pilus assembly protein TadD